MVNKSLSPGHEKSLGLATLLPNGGMYLTLYGDYLKPRKRLREGLRESLELCLSLLKSGTADVLCRSYYGCYRAWALPGLWCHWLPDEQSPWLSGARYTSLLIYKYLVSCIRISWTAAFSILLRSNSGYVEGYAPGVAP